MSRCLHRVSPLTTLPSGTPSPRTLTTFLETDHSRCHCMGSTMHWVSSWPSDSSQAAIPAIVHHPPCPCFDSLGVPLGVDQFNRPGVVHKGGTSSAQLGLLYALNAPKLDIKGAHVALFVVLCEFLCLIVRYNLATVLSNDLVCLKPPVSEQALPSTCMK